MAFTNTDLFLIQRDDTKYKATFAALQQAIGGSDGRATMSDNAPAAPVAGDFWWNTSDGILYIYYEDANSSQWVQSVPQGNPNAGFVSVSTNPPTTPQEGSLWWKSDVGIMYVSYVDPSGDQYWVDTSPAGVNPAQTRTYMTVEAPSDVADGDMWFNPQNGTLSIQYTDANSTTQWVAMSSGLGTAAINTATPFDFPSSPSEGDNYTPTTGNVSYTYNGAQWIPSTVTATSKFDANMNYADKATAGTGALGDIAVIGGSLCFHDGTDWKEITLGSAPA